MAIFWLVVVLTMPIYGVEGFPTRRLCLHTRQNLPYSKCEAFSLTCPFRKLHHNVRCLKNNDTPAKRIARDLEQQSHVDN